MKQKQEIVGERTVCRKIRKTSIKMTLLQLCFFKFKFKIKKLLLPPFQKKYPVDFDDE